MQLRVRCDIDPSGPPKYEKLLTEPRPDGSYSLLRAPSITLGLAAGDVFGLDDEGFARVHHRGGNITVQVLSLTPLSREDLARLDRAAVRLGGTFDVHTEHTVGLTIPVSAGFGEIEQTFDKFCEGRDGCEWSLANVFDGDGNPLNWWQGS